MIYIVSTLGSDTNPGTVMEPLATFEHAKATMHGGDTLMLRGGTYTEGLAGIPSGLGTWDTATTIQAYEGEPVVINGEYEGYVYYTSGANWIVFDDLVLDGIATTKSLISIGDNSHHHRFIDCEMYRAAWNGIIFKGDCNELLRCTIHDCGTAEQRGHGVYIKGNDNVVSRCEISGNPGHGVQIFDNEGDVLECDRNLVEYSEMHHNGFGEYYEFDEPGAGVYIGVDNIIRGNLIHDEWRGIEVAYNARNTLLEDNAISDCLDYGIIIRGVGSSYGTAIDTVLRDNTFSGCGVDIVDEGENTSIDQPEEDPPEEEQMGAVDDIRAAIEAIRANQAEIEAELVKIEAALVEVAEADVMADALAEKL